MAGLPTSFSAQDFVIFAELGFTLDQIKAQFCVDDAFLEAMAAREWPEDGSAENSLQRRRRAGPMHLIRTAYLQAESNPRLLMFLLEKLWQPTTAATVDRPASVLTDAQLIQIHSIIKGTMA